MSDVGTKERKSDSPSAIADQQKIGKEKQGLCICVKISISSPSPSFNRYYNNSDILATHKRARSYHDTYSALIKHTLHPTRVMYHVPLLLQVLLLLLLLPPYCSFVLIIIATQ